MNNLSFLPKAQFFKNWKIINKDTLILSNKCPRLLAAFIFNPEELGDTTNFAKTLLQIKNIRPPIKKTTRTVGGELFFVWIFDIPLWIKNLFATTTVIELLCTVLECKSILCNTVPLHTNLSTIDQKVIYHNLVYSYSVSVFFQLYQLLM